MENRLTSIHHHARRAASTLLMVLLAIALMLGTVGCATTGTSGETRWESDEVPYDEAAIHEKVGRNVRDGFVGIFEAMAGRPVTIRFLDPPLHEFLPHEAEQVEAVAKALGLPLKDVQQKNESLH